MSTIRFVGGSMNGQTKDYQIPPGDCIHVAKYMPLTLDSIDKAISDGEVQAIFMETETYRIRHSLYHDEYIATHIEPPCPKTPRP